MRSTQDGRMSAHNCPDCKVEMEIGFLPDRSYYDTHHAGWHRGEDADMQSFSSMKALSKYFKKETVPITAWRCTQCGLLRLYAMKPEGE